MGKRDKETCSTQLTFSLPAPIITRAIRLYPERWANHPKLHINFLSCNLEGMLCSKLFGVLVCSLQKTRSLLMIMCRALIVTSLHQCPPRYHQYVDEVRSYDEDEDEEAAIQ